MWYNVGKELFKGDTIWYYMEKGVIAMYGINRQLPEALVKKIREFFTDYPQVAAVYLFGSYGTEYQLPSSDLDLGIVFVEDPVWKEVLEIDAELASLLHTDSIDLVNLNQAPLDLQYRVLREGVLLLEKDYLVNSNFIEKVTKYYWDYSISHRKFMQDYEAALKEAYSNGGKRDNKP